MHALAVTSPHRALRAATAAALGLLLVVTRGAHVASPVALPDATLAVFFLVGLYEPRVRGFVAALGLALLADAMAIGSAGLGAACVGGAYAFLVPAYACLWCAGRRTAADTRTGSGAALRTVARLTAAAGLAFLISNLSYYAFTDLVRTMSVGEYAARTWRYAPPYVGNALLYVGLAWGVRELARRVAAGRGRARVSVA
jgi:hypothetical protein